MKKIILAAALVALSACQVETDGDTSKNTTTSTRNAAPAVTFVGPRVGFDGRVRIAPSMTPGIGIGF